MKKQLRELRLAFALVLTFAAGALMPAAFAQMPPPGANANPAGPGGPMAPGAKGPPRLSEHEYLVDKISEHVYEFRYGNRNSMFIVTPDGVIVTDPIAQRRPDIAQTYMAEIRKITQAPIRYLIYSHTHFDHSSGGKIFKDAGAIVIAQRKARDRLREVSTPEIVPIDEVVDDKRVIELGGVRLELLYFGPNHSDNMLVMFVPKEKVLFGVDWLGGRAPAPGGFEGDSYMHNWELGLRKVMALDWDVMIGGHGPGLTHKDGIAMEIDYMNDASAIAKVMADTDTCTLHDTVATPTPIPEKYKNFTTEVNWAAVLNRYCIYWNQGY